MQTPPPNQSQDDGRRSRFANDHHSVLAGFRESSLPAALRDRPTSQPPRRQGDILSQRRFDSFGASNTPPPSAVGPGSMPWSPSRHASFNQMNQQPPSPSSASAMVGNFSQRSVPTRSLSFSTSSDLPSRFHPFMRESLPSTFVDEEDEYDAILDMGDLGGPPLSASQATGPRSYSQSGLPNSMSASYDFSQPIRGTRAAALAAADNASRSRSQSLAATSRRQIPLGLGSQQLPHPGSSALLHSWSESPSGVTSSGYPSGGRGIPVGSRPSGPPDLSNMSPFVRDIDQILLDEGTTFRDYWANVSGIAEEGPGSGATSRRHSVSVVQPRTRRSSAVTGFPMTGSMLGTAIEDDDSDTFPQHMDRRAAASAWESSSSGFGSGLGSAGSFATGRFGGGAGRSMIADDELAGDLNSLSLNLELQSRSQASPASRRVAEGGSGQAASLPLYGLVQHIPQQYQPSQSPLSAGLSRAPTNGAQASSPSFQQTPTSRREASGDSNAFSGPQVRRPSVSPSRFGERGVSREREAVGDAAIYRQILGQNAGWNPNGDVQQARHGLGSGYGGQLPSQGGGRLPSPTSHRTLIGATSPLGNAATATANYFNGGLGSAAGGGFGQSTNSGAFAPSKRAGDGGSPLQIRTDGNAAGNLYAPRSPSDRLSSHPPSARAGATYAPMSPGAPTPANPPTSAVNELGRGVPLHRIAASTPMYVVEFKASRSDLFFCGDPRLNDELALGDLVIVEADRGRDLGKIVQLGITGEEVEKFQRLQIQKHNMMMGGQAEEDGPNGLSPVRASAKEIMPKRLYSKATPQEIDLLRVKAQDEAKALQLCQTKVRAKKLPMEVLEAEYQWDRRKLTFYFVSDRRIDFRELVRELFRLYKTRIWMACLQGPAASEG